MEMKRRKSESELRQSLSKTFNVTQARFFYIIVCALKKSLNLSLTTTFNLQSFDYLNFTNHCASFAVISFDSSHSIVVRRRINEMSKIENSMLKGWEFIIDAVALLVCT